MVVDVNLRSGKSYHFEHVETVSFTPNGVAILVNANQEPIAMFPVAAIDCLVHPGKDTSIILAAAEAANPGLKLVQ